MYLSRLCALTGEPLSSGSSSDDSAEFNQVTAALISIFKIDAKGKCCFLIGQGFVFPNWTRITLTVEV